MDDSERQYLQRCVELATEALHVGDEPFGSVLVDQHGTIRAEDRNRVAFGDRTQHPEFNLARWSATHLTPEERAAATVYTSGEHCAMCAAAHAWVGLHRIVYITSAAQLTEWLTELNVSPGPVRPLPIQEVAPDVVVEGPIPEFVEQIRELQRQCYQHRK